MLKCVLLDANIIIEAYHLGIWDKLIEKVEISVSSIVAHTEALFYDHKGKRVPESINLNNLIAAGKIKEHTASYEDLAELYSLFDRVFIEGIHEGEAECLALIQQQRVKDTLFCSGDAAAIQALAMLGRSEDGISLEALLKKTGLKQSLRRQFTEKFFRENLRQGAQNRIMQTGLRKK
ncbi:MAG: hypothetical protein ABIJ52_16755 [Pseudomonadota bacterium]|nr:hypothetical protein [Pseudomonadota bacterium]MBU1569432.1 hypothetical protein [Pseudomonadota bacterium]